MNARAALAGTLLAAALLGGCDRSGPTAAPPAASSASVGALRILAGSELRELAPALQQAAQQAGVPVQFEFAGSLDIVDRSNRARPDSGERGFDAILPAGGAYPALALRSPPLAVERLFYSRIALGVKTSRWRELGWDRQPPGWAQIAEAVRAGRLRYAMSSPSRSNSGMSALFAVAAAAAGKTEDMTLADVRTPEAEALLRDFLSGHKLTAGSSGWLAEAYGREQDTLDAMVNYESVILGLNARQGTDALKEPLVPVYPADGVISADYPLMLLAPADEALRARFQKLVQAWRSAAVQGEVLAQAFLRPSNPEVRPAAALPVTPVVELAFPGRLEVIDAVLGAWQGEWRRPATAIFVLDVSGSMEGERIAALRQSLRLLAGAEPADSLSARHARFQQRERVVMLPFGSEVGPAERVEFGAAGTDIGASAQAADTQAAARIRAYAEALSTGGGTALYSALARALEIARQEMRMNPDRLVSVVLLSDGLKTAGIDLQDFEQRWRDGDPVRIFPILFGDASQSEMQHIAALGGGRVFDARSASLEAVFKDIRGYQ